MKKYGYLVGGHAIIGELVGKPPIARKFHQIPYNFLIFATFGGIRGLFCVQQAYCNVPILVHYNFTECYAYQSSEIGVTESSRDIEWFYWA
jgi:hypothetical protein